VKANAITKNALDGVWMPTSLDSLASSPVQAASSSRTSAAPIHTKA
jgi:hypothetical protein